jgi:hypothetical protein
MPKFNARDAQFPPPKRLVPTWASGPRFKPVIRRRRFGLATKCPILATLLVLALVALLGQFFGEWLKS